MCFSVTLFNFILCGINICMFIYVYAAHKQNCNFSAGINKVFLFLINDACIQPTYTSTPSKQHRSVQAGVPIPKW